MKKKDRISIRTKPEEWGSITNFANELSMNKGEYLKFTHQITSQILALALKNQMPACGIPEFLKWVVDNQDFEDQLSILADKWTAKQGADLNGADLRGAEIITEEGEPKKKKLINY